MALVDKLKTARSYIFPTPNERQLFDRRLNFLYNDDDYLIYPPFCKFHNSL